MRAIISCNTHITDNELKSVLSDINWNHNVENIEISRQNLNEITMQKRTEILCNLPSDIESIIESTTVCTIYDSVTKTWGVVTRPNKYRLTFRLKNPIFTTLKMACEDLVLKLQSVSYSECSLSMEDSCGENENLIKYFANKLSFLGISKKSMFEFSPIIQILERNNDYDYIHGQIVNKNSFKISIQERTIEFYVSLFAGIIAILLFYITSPLFPYSSFRYDYSWGNWLFGILEQLMTASLVTTVILFLEVYLHWRSIRGRYPIKWIE